MSTPSLQTFWEYFPGVAIFLHLTILVALGVYALYLDTSAPRPLLVFFAIVCAVLLAGELYLCFRARESQSSVQLQQRGLYFFLLILVIYVIAVAWSSESEEEATTTRPAPEYLPSSVELAGIKSRTQRTGSSQGRPLLQGPRPSAKARSGKSMRLAQPRSPTATARG